MADCEQFHSFHCQQSETETPDAYLPPVLANTPIADAVIRLATYQEYSVNSNTAKQLEPLQPESQATREDATAVARDIAERIKKLNKAKPGPGRSAAPSASQRMTFNPLHPSMELPPEQLIRLMTLHAQYRHKLAKKRADTTRRTIQSEATHSPSLASRPDYAVTESSHGRSHKRLVLLTLLFASLAGYMFLQTNPGSKPDETETVGVMTPAQPSPESSLPTTIQATPATIPETDAREASTGVEETLLEAEPEEVINEPEAGLAVPPPETDLLDTSDLAADETPLTSPDDAVLPAPTEPAGDILPPAPVEDILEETPL